MVVFLFEFLVNLTVFEVYDLFGTVFIDFRTINIIKIADFLLYFIGWIWLENTRIVREFNNFIRIVFFWRIFMPDKILNIFKFLPWINEQSFSELVRGSMSDWIILLYRAINRPLIKTSPSHHLLTWLTLIHQKMLLT